MGFHVKKKRGKRGGGVYLKGYRDMPSLLTIQFYFMYFKLITLFQDELVENTALNERLTP